MSLCPWWGDQAVRLAFSITSFLISLRGNREESDCAALNYPTLSPSTFLFHIPLLFLHFFSLYPSLSFTSFLLFFSVSHYTLPARLSGLWGVTLQESGCNNTAVICLDLIWSQSSWERERERCVERWIKKGRERERERQTEDNKRDRGETVWETDCVLGALIGPWGRVSVFYLDLLGLPVRSFSSCKPADLPNLNKVPLSWKEETSSFSIPFHC